MPHCLWQVVWLLPLFSSTVSWGAMTSSSDYKISYEPVVSNTNSMPVELSDIKKFTEEAVMRRLNAWKKKPVAEIVDTRMNDDATTRKFFTSGRLTQWARGQNRFPHVITIKKGLATLELLYRKCPECVTKQAEDTYLSLVPIIVGQGGGLIISKKQTLRLSEGRGSFLVNAGEVYVMHGKLLGWREVSHGPALFTGDKHKFRPFFTAWSGSHTYMVDSDISHLGSATTKAYGLSLSSYSANDVVYAPKEIELGKRPTGWFIGNRFSDMFYGFYCYEAENVVILRNVYKDNYYYGIDPHDRSRGLIIAENTVFGTKVRHGIIGSREVDDSFIFRNVSFHNNLSGIMLDRLSSRNVVAQNVAYENGSDGITMYESHDNLLWANQVYRNKHHGIRFRNSKNTRIIDNVIVNNERYGIYGHIKDLSYQGYRDLKLDPYDRHASALISGGIIGMNLSGAIYADSTDYLKLEKVKLERNGGGELPLRGALYQWNQQILSTIRDGVRQVLITASASN